MKIVINRCYGGFELSAAAEGLLSTKRGVTLHKYEQVKHKYLDGVAAYQRRAADKKVFCPTILTEDHGDYFEGDFKEGTYWYSGDIDRDDPLLIEVVEELGEEEASGDYAKLEIVEIPDDVGWYLDDYDGFESIHENHRSW